MKKYIFWAVAVAVTVLTLTFNAVAQPGGGRGPGMGGPGMGGPRGPGMMRLLQSEDFIKILDLTTEQSSDMQRIFTESAEEMRAQIQAQFQAGGPPQPPNFNEMRERAEEFMQTTQKKIDEALKPEQRTKFREITFQLMGGLESPMLGVQMLETLDLSDAQKEQVRKVLNDQYALGAGNLQNFDFANASREERQQFMEKIRTDMQARNKEVREKITGLLTAEQKTKAEKLTKEAPALREKMGMNAPGQGQQQRGQRFRQGEGRYMPGEGSWRPGQGAPEQGVQAPPPRRGGFPRGEEDPRGGGERGQRGPRGER